MPNENSENEKVLLLTTQDMLRNDLLNWIKAERENYADQKWSGENRERLVKAMEDEGFGDIWRDFILNYLKRAELFGLDTLQGRQAMGKAIVTMLHCLETAIEIYGTMPQPGFPSGEIR